MLAVVVVLVEEMVVLEVVELLIRDLRLTQELITLGVVLLVDQTVSEVKVLFTSDTQLHN
jgi:hypothetical protein